MKINLRAYAQEAYLSGYYPSLFQFLSAKAEVLYYYGFLGDRNFGDEWVWDSARWLFQSRIVFPLARRLPLGYLAMGEKWRNSKVCGIVIGGGTLIGQFNFPKLWGSFLEQRPDVPVIFHGTGVVSSGPTSSLWGDLFRRPVFGGVRGEDSRAIIAEAGWDVGIVGDAALIHYFRNASRPQKPSGPGGGKRVLINLGTHGDYPGREHVRATVTELLGALKREGYSTTFVSCHGTDETIYKESIEPTNGVECGFFDASRQGPEKLGELMRSSIFAVGERLHFAVAASVFGCPFLSINYAGKHREFLASLDLLDFGVAPMQFGVDMLIHRLAEKDYWKNRVLRASSRISDLATRQREESVRFLQAVEGKCKP